MCSTTYISVICLIAYFSTAETSDNWVTYELEGKLTERYGPYISVNSWSAKADLRGPEGGRFKRASNYQPSLDFAGSLTVKSSRETVVVGVNTTLQFAVVRNEPEDFESNRVKRDDDSPQVELALYGQFALGERLPKSQVLRVRLNMDLRQVSQQRKPNTDSKETQFGFKGTISASGRSTDVLNLALNLGVKHESFTNTDYDYDGQGPREDRYKRNSDNIPTLKIAGQFNIDAPSNTVVFGVNGEAQFEVATVSDEMGPRDKFLKAEGGNQVLFETAGNVTGKVDDVTIFTTPLATEVGVEAERVRKKRGSRDDQVLELDYDGVFKTTAGGSVAQEAGVTLRSKFWLISKSRIPSE